MGYKSGADGVAKKGKTSVEIFPNDGKKVTPLTEGKGGRKSQIGKDMKKYGRNIARVMNQKRGG